MYVAGDTNMATIQLFHNQIYASKLILPCEKLTLDIEQVNEDEDFVVYPNPVKEILYLNGLVEFKSFSLKDIFGREVLNGESTNSIDVNHLKTGIYFIVLNFGNEIKTIKFLKE